MTTTHLDYESDGQFVRAAADAYLREHLKCSSSLEGVPSDRLSSLGCMAARAYERHEAEAGREVGRDEAVAHVEPLCRRACAIADERWAAARVLLGL